MAFEYWDQYLEHEILDLSPILETVIMTEGGFISTIPLGEKATSPKFEWEEEVATEQKVTAHASTGALTTSGTTLNLVAAQGVRLRAGMLLLDEASGKAELLRVESISTDAVTVARNHPVGGTGESHAVDAVYKVVSAPIHERFEPAEGLWTPRTPVTSLCQIFEREANVPMLWKYIKSKVVPDELQHRLTLRTSELATEFNRAMIYSKGGRIAIGGIEYDFMSGITDYLTQAGAHYVTSPAAMSSDVIDDLNETIQAPDKDMPNTILAGSGVGGYLDNLMTDKVRVEQAVSTVGTFQKQVFKTRKGNDLKIVRDNTLKPNEFILYNPKHLARRPLMPLHPRQVPTKAIIEQTQLLCAFGLEYRNAPRFGAYQVALTGI